MKRVQFNKFFVTGVIGYGLALTATYLLVLADPYTNRSDPEALPMAIFLSCLAWLLIWPLTHWVMVTSVGPNRAAFIKPDSQDAKLVLQSATNLRLWRWDQRLNGADIINIEPKENESLVWMNVRPITSNPGVRDIKYWVQVNCSTPEGLITMWKALNFRKPGQLSYSYSRAMETWLTSMLYDFNEKRRHELAAFFNPLDPEQQARFKQLLQDFLAPELQRTGLTLADACFTEV